MKVIKVAKQARQKPERFILRIDEEVYNRLDALSLSHERSTNSEICYAVDQWYNAAAREKFFHRMLFGVGQDKPQEVIPFRQPPGSDPIVKTMIRFEYATLNNVRRTADERKESMNGRIVWIVKWWIELHEDFALAQAGDAG